MPTQTDPPLTATTDTNVKKILEWLALAHGRTGADDAESLHQQLQTLRAAPIPSSQRLKLLDLLFTQSERCAHASLPAFKEVSLPISKRHRQRVRALLDMLATLTQDYFNTLADVFDPAIPIPIRSAGLSLRRAMAAIAWQVRITQLVAAPPPLGLWQQLHAAYRNAKRLGQESLSGPSGNPSIQRIYTSILLSAIAQPASFSSDELEFINEYITNALPEIELATTPPLDSTGVFWLDPDKDTPAQALVRRIPGPDAEILYFSCDSAASLAARHAAELKQGIAAELLGLPAFADTHTGPGILERLAKLWGSPTKRRFPRRRQSYRAKLCSGLGNLWHLMKEGSDANCFSEWMVTNESPDGYALMHIAGATTHLRVGDIVSLQATETTNGDPPAWHICIIRWALSENPAHIEIGLQMLAPKAVAVELASTTDRRTDKVAALILPPTPPLRPTQSLVVPTGLIREHMHHIVILLEHDNLLVRELQTTQLDEQTCSIEIFTVLPEASD